MITPLLTTNLRMLRGDKFRGLVTSLQTTPATGLPKLTTTVVNGRFPPRASKPFKPFSRDR